MDEGATGYWMLCTNATTSARSWPCTRPAGIGLLPWITRLRMKAGERPSPASLGPTYFRVPSPAWQVSQLAAKTAFPAAASPGPTGAAGVEAVVGVAVVTGALVTGGDVVAGAPPESPELPQPATVNAPHTATAASAVAVRARPVPRVTG